MIRCSAAVLFAIMSEGAGDGLCMRCHASSAEELIFSTLENVARIACA
jgi:hypothetical protein